MRVINRGGEEVGVQREREGTFGLRGEQVISRGMGLFQIFQKQ